MNTVERIRVYVDVEKGKTICICPADRKRCDKKCIRDSVSRDKFESWEKTYRRNRYGK